MQKLLFLFFIFFSCFGFSQTEIVEEEAVEASENVIYKKDSIDYDKNINYATKRKFQRDLKEKYNGKDFEYTDDVKKPKSKKPKKSKPIDPSFAKGLIGFLSTIFPYLLGAIVIIIILRSFIDVDPNFWKFRKSDTKVAERLIHEDTENIEENDFDSLLKLAIKNENYRLATRYYYLALLKKLTQKKLIKYHKDKTNTQYLFEIEDSKIRNEFSYLSYIYNYVWYGEFPVDNVKFETIKHKYFSFLKMIN